MMASSISVTTAESLKIQNKWSTGKLRTRWTDQVKEDINESTKSMDKRGVLWDK